MESSARTLEADDRANELYWGSDRSVNQIAEDLGLSKGALYGMIRPLAAALGCPTCGAEVVHPNRTAKERGLVDCPVCGWNGTEGESVQSFAPPEADGGPTPSVRARPAPPSSASEGAPPAAVLGGALLGAAAGLALLFWVRRR